jgi:hypothetical protein
MVASGDQPEPGGEDPDGDGAELWYGWVARGARIYLPVKRSSYVRTYIRLRHGVGAIEYSPL